MSTKFMMPFIVFFALFLLMCQANANPQADLNITDPKALQILQ
jgi:hypothetical protein